MGIHNMPLQQQETFTMLNKTTTEYVALKAEQAETEELAEAFLDILEFMACRDALDSLDGLFRD